MDDVDVQACPTEEGGEAGAQLVVGDVLLARFAFEGRDPEDVRLSDVRGPGVFRVAVDREPEGVHSLGDNLNMAFRLRLGREAEDGM